MGPLLVVQQFNSFTQLHALFSSDASDHSTPSIAEDKNAQSYTSTPSFVFMRLYIKFQKKISTFVIHFDVNCSTSEAKKPKENHKETFLFSSVVTK
jgi:hypothetical protein